MADQGFSTRALHGGAEADHAMVTRPKAMPLYETSVFVYENLDQVDDFLGGNRDNYMYTRLGNPNQRALEIWGVSMEEGEDALVCASGMAALTAVLASECSSGDIIAAARDIYGGTHSLLEKELSRFGIGVDFLSVEDPAAVERSLKKGTKVLLVETSSNPLVQVADVPALAQAAHRRGARLVVDNTFLSPVLFQPLKHGADAVIHSTTKYINGHSDASGGLIVAGRRMDCVLPQVHAEQRGTPQPVRGLAHAARRKDDHAEDGAPLRQRAGAGGMAGRTDGREPRALPGSHQSSPSRRCLAAVSPRHGRDDGIRPRGRPACR